MGKPTEPKRSTKVNKTIQIIGDNVLYNHGIITAFYIIPLSNYATNSYAGIDGQVANLVKMVQNLTSVNPSVLFTIENIQKTIVRADVLRNLVETIKIYKQEYNMPEEFTKNVKKDVQNYCLLGIDIQQSTVTNVEDNTLGETIKALGKSVINLFSTGSTIDPERILQIEENIFRCLYNSNCVRASKDLVFYNYVSRLFPCFEISYDKMSYINENNYEAIMGAVTQTISDNFGWFEMHNEGVDIFGLEPETTYGCILNVASFPEQINSANFPMADEYWYDLVTTIKCMKKDDATIKMKRSRSADRYEVNTAVAAGAEEESIEKAEKNIAIASDALSRLENGETICEFNTILVVYAESRQELTDTVMHIMTAMKDRNILIAKSLTQAADFLQYYVNKKPRKFMHMAPLIFPLSFQQNSGASVGDDADLRTSEGKPIWSPSIGEDIT